MPTMSNRIFLSLALLCLAFTSVRSYGSYGGYGPRDEGLRQVRRCPTCPPDCPEALAAPSWYRSPIVYGQPPPFNAPKQDFEDRSQPPTYAAVQTHLRDSPNPYANLYYGGSNPYVTSRCPCADGRCNARLARSGNGSPEASSTPAVPTTIKESFDASVGSFRPIDTRSINPYGYPRFPSAVGPESYRGLSSFVANPAENHRVSKHYGNAYQNSIHEANIQEDSLVSNPSTWNSFSQHPTGDYEAPENIIYEGQLKAIETPSQKKVYVVYRADADQSTDDEDLQRSLINASRQQLQQTMDASPLEAANPMTDSQLEEVVRRAIAAATRRNVREEELYGHQQRRGIFYNEQERDQEESYNPRRPYNDALYQRFNAEEAIDRQERRKLYRSGFGPSEVVFTPSMHYNPYVLSGDTGIQNVPAMSEALEGNLQDVPGITAWEQQELSAGVAQNAGGDLNEFSSAPAEEQRTTILEELRDISREEAKQQEQKNFNNAQDFATMKRQIDYEAVEPPPINYRTSSRTSETTSLELKDNEEVEERDDKTTKALRNGVEMEQDGDGPPIAINPDLMEDMVMPPTDDSEVGLQLSFESSDNTTPSPAN